MNTGENKIDPVLVPSEKMEGGREELCPLLPVNMQIKRIWEYSKVCAFLCGVTRQGHVHNSADAGLQKPWPRLVVTELSSSESRLVATTSERSYIYTRSSSSATVTRPSKLKDGTNPTVTPSSFYAMLLTHLFPFHIDFQGTGKNCLYVCYHASCQGVSKSIAIEIL